MDTVSIETQTQVDKAATADPVLAIAVHLARQWDRPENIAAITAGMPLENGRLAEYQLDSVLTRLGIETTRTHKSLASLANYEFPALFKGQDGKLLVCMGRESRKAMRCFDPATGVETLYDRSLLDFRLKRELMLARPVFGQTSTGEEHKRTHWLRSAVSKSRTSLAYLLLASVFINLFAIVFPLFTLNVYDRVLPNAAIPTLWVLAIGVALVLVFDLVLKVARGSVIDHFGRQIDFHLSSALFDRVVNTRMEARPGSTGAFINRIGQFEVMREFFTSSTVVMFVDVLFLVLFAWVITTLVGWLVVFPLLAGLLAVIVTLVIGWRSGRYVEATLAESSARNAILVEALSSIQSVKAARAEGEFLRRWENTILATSTTQQKIRWYQSLATSVTGTASQLALVAIVIGGTYRFSEGDVTMGAIIATMILSNRLIAPINMLAAALMRARSARQALKTIGEIMDMPDERSERATHVGRTVKKGAIEFRKVRFQYPGAPVHVLDGVSFSVAPGEKVGVIGRIGSGKTTLGRLLVNFYAPTEGEILIDGVAINQYHPHALRSQVGLLLQDPELFNGTVRENILLSDPTADEERFLSVAQRAGVEDFVARHPMGYDMPVGEQGCLLSGGQRQAVALARTMLPQPKVMFLDEPSSSMDLATEKRLISHLSNSLMPDLTVLIATHRHSLLALVSRLIVIEDGRIVADGPRDDVLKRLRGPEAGS